jgi:dipeptidyl aminopeptidase/acylaminoacyl peptidase
MTDPMPAWKQRMRAPQLLSFSLLGPPVAWAHDQPDRGVLLSTLGGRVEVFAFDASEPPATLTQVTRRPQGTIGAAISPDAKWVFWFDDHSGDEVGRWIRHDLSDGSEVTMLPGLDRSYSAGIQPGANGAAVVGRIVDAGFELALADPDGSGHVVHTFDEPANLVDVSSDRSLALIGYAPDGDWLHMGLRVVRLSDGVVVAELALSGKDVQGIAFRPGYDSHVLVAHEPDDRVVPAIWNTTSGILDTIAVPLVGDVAAKWYPDGGSLLLIELIDARHSLHRIDLETQVTTTLREADGVVLAASARPDGSVHLLHSRSDKPVSLGRLAGNGQVEELVVLPGERPRPSIRARDVRAVGPAGEVHALLQVPPDRDPPYATLFVPHGGPTAQDFDGWNDSLAAYVDHGYAVVRVNYRGSTGYGARWRDALTRRIGYIEMEDITAVRDLLEKDGIVDPERVSITGGSWGGYLSLMAVGLQPERWRSAAALVPVADWFTMTEDSPPFMQAYDRSLFGESITDEPELYRMASPITYVDDVVAPLFISAGENDPRCPVRQIDLYVEAIRDRSGQVQYDRLDTGHGLFDIDVRVHEVGRVLDFITSTNPV